MLKDKRQYTIGRIILLLIPLSIILCPSCQFKEEEFVDFLNIEAGKGMKFQVIGRRLGDG